MPAARSTERDVAVLSRHGQVPVALARTPGRRPHEPAVPERPPAAADGRRPGAERPRPAGAETILLVEDEDGVRKLVELTLAANGYRVLPARCASEALELMAGADERIDLLLTDVVMPGVSGPELAARVEALAPGVRVLLMSGYTGGHRSAGPDGRPLLAKPFTRRELVQAVSDTLAGRPLPRETAPRPG